MNIFIWFIIFYSFASVGEVSLLSLEDSNSSEKIRQTNSEAQIVEIDLQNKDIPDANILDQDFILNKTNENIKAFWKTDFKISTFVDRSTTNSILSTEIYGKINWKFMNGFSFHTQGLIIGRSGFTQSIYDRVDRKNGLYLLEGYFDVNLSPTLLLRFGSVKQDFLKAPLFISDKTFPSLIQSITIPLSEDSKISFIFQQAIPNNATESVKRETQVVKWTPLFLTLSAFFDLNSISAFDISFTEKLTSFYFTNLSAAVAESGRIRGNTINLYSSDSRFKYRFLSIHNNVNLLIPLSEDWILELGGDVLYNVLAPDTFNQGERFYTSLYHNYKNFLEIKVMTEYFANQSDSSVSYYNSEVYGHNNRVGGLLKLQTHFYNSGITLGMTYVHSKPINKERSSVGVLNSFALFLGTSYVSI